MSQLVEIIDEGGTYDVHTGIATVTYTYVYSDGSRVTVTEQYDTHDQGSLSARSRGTLE